jgi:hypothetical protein
MAKFYVSSGNFQLVVNADDAQAAAIWGVHRCLAPIVPHVCEHGELTDGVEQEAGLSYEASVAHRKLGESISISEQGFGGADTQELPTLPIVAEWTRLLVAIERIYAELA